MRNIPQYNKNYVLQTYNQYNMGKVERISSKTWKKKGSLSTLISYMLSLLYNKKLKEMQIGSKGVKLCLFAFDKIV